MEKINLDLAVPPVKFNSHGDVLLNKNQLGQIIGVDVDAFLVSCRQRNDFLEEIQICFRIQSNLENTYENCRAVKNNDESPYNMEDTCPETFRLIGFKKGAAASQ